MAWREKLKGIQHNAEQGEKRVEQEQHIEEHHIPDVSSHRETAHKTITRGVLASSQRKSRMSKSGSITKQKEGREPLTISNTFLPLEKENMIEGPQHKDVVIEKGDASQSMWRSIFAKHK